MLLAYIGIDKISFLQFEDDQKQKIKLLYHQKYNNDFLFTAKETSYIFFKEIISQAVSRLNINDKEIKIIFESEILNYKRLEVKLPYNNKIQKYIRKNIINDIKSDDVIFPYFVNKNINIKNRNDQRECYYSTISLQMYNEIKIAFKEQGFKVVCLEPFFATIVDFFIDEINFQIKNNYETVLIFKKQKYLYTFVIKESELLFFNRYIFDNIYTKEVELNIYIENEIKKINEIISYRIGEKFNVIYFPLKEELKDIFKEKLEKNLSINLINLKVPLELNDLTEIEFNKYIEVAALYKKTVSN